MTWENMGTAPKDGTPILVCFGASIPDVPLIHVASKCEGEHCKELGYEEYEFGGAWMVWIDQHDWFMFPPTAAVKWMHIPA